jgi:hypothetical protein
MSHVEYVTVAEIGFAPYLLNLHKSLMRHAGNFHLTIACADRDLFRLLEGLGLDRTSMIDVTPSALPLVADAVRDRSLAEYCWTLTPFLPGLVFNDRPQADAVTYVDADVWLLNSPRPIHEEFRSTGASCYLTPHAFSPEWDASATSGFFCVQYLPVRREGSQQILATWQQQCLARCSSVPQAGGLGDQGYLNDWPSTYGDAVHIASQPSWFQGPWNCERFPFSEAITYHFHGLRLKSANRVWLGTNPIPAPTFRQVYLPYIQELKESAGTVASSGFPLRYVDHPMSWSHRTTSALGRIRRWTSRVIPSRSVRM